MNNMLVLLNRLDIVEDYLSKIRKIAKTHGIEKVYLARVLREFGSRLRSRVAPHKLDMAAKMSDDAAGRYLSKVADDLRKDGLDVEPITAGIPAKGIDDFIKKNNVNLIITSDGCSELCRWPARGFTEIKSQILCQHIFTEVRREQHACSAESS